MRVDESISLVVPFDGDRPLDQLDVQVAMAVNIIRRDANDARHRLGLEPRNYDYEVLSLRRT